MDNTETLVLYVCSVSEVLFCFVLDGRQCLSSMLCLYSCFRWRTTSIQSMKYFLICFRWRTTSIQSMKYFLICFRWRTTSVQSMKYVLLCIPANLWNLQWGRSPPQLWQLRGRFCTNNIFSLNIWPIHHIHLQNTNKS